MFELYKALLIERENDGKRLWLIFGLMNIINGALLTFVATGEITPGITKPILILVGLSVSIYWWGVTSRMSAWVEWWETKLVELEQEAFKAAKNNGTCVPADFKVFVNRESIVQPGFSTKKVSQILPFIFAIAWLIMLFDVLRPQGHQAIQYWVFI
jgi:hypothetical protein